MGMEDKNIHILEEILYSDISESDKRRFDKDKAWQRFLLRTGKANEPVYRKKSWRILWQSAAAIALLLIGSYLYFLFDGKQQEQLAAVNDVNDVHIEASWGSLVKTCLPDGTMVWLNADSKLAYSQEFGINDRNVSLSGEGYFEVARNEKLPFCVQTDELQVKVLGTKFNFRNYPDDREATVCLLEGKVGLGNNVRQNDEIMMMEPDQKVFLDKNSGDIRMKNVTASNTMAWTTGYLFFDEDLLQDIAKDLERSYDVKITVHPDAAKMRFYGSFCRKEQSVKDILDILASTEKIKYNMNGKEFRISPN